MLKMQTILLLLVLLGQIFLSLQQCYYKREFVQTRPRPMKNFNPEKVKGRWYTVDRYIPCGFQGFRDFTDDTRDVELNDTTQTFSLIRTYRVGKRCQKLADTRSQQTSESCAVVYTKDNIGDLYSGERIMVVTDYKKFLIQWGCLNYSMLDPKICKDVTMAIHSRTPKLHPVTSKIIDFLLKKMFNLTLAELDVIKQDNPCD